MAKIFITGISGFVGKELARQFIEDGHTVSGTSFRSKNNVHVTCDLRKLEDISAALAYAQPDVIIHAAALSSVTCGSTMDYYENNVLATENLISAVDCLGGRKRLIFISTAGVYGNQPVDVLSEDLNPLPVSHYGMSKFVCERLMAVACESHDVTVIRPFNIIGMGQNTGFIIPKLVQHFAERKPSIRLGNLDPVRDYLDIQTCATIIKQLTMNANANGETINVCAGMGTSVRELLSILTELTGHSIEVIAAPEFIRKSEVWCLLGSTAKLSNILQSSVAPRSIRAVLEEMLNAAQPG